MIIFTNQVIEALDSLIASFAPSGVFVIGDHNTSRFVIPVLQQASSLADAHCIQLPAGDANKTLESLSHVWSQLTDKGATRKAVVVNVGGGMITDLGGFAAATFKRGVRFINVPTTLLSAVDAAVGGKTGINFHGLKNEIGTFKEADAVIISTVFFKTLPDQELLSGYAEMLKHALLEDKATLADLLNYDISAEHDDPDALLDLVERSVQVKKDIVAADPTEQGIRKALNLGHTVGHAIESLAMERQRPVPHGYAVAWGLVAELVLSHMILGFDSDTLHQVAAYIKEHYGPMPVSCDDYPRLLELMRHDKKNATADAINFTLLSAVGTPEINQTATDADIRSAIDIARDFMA